MDPRFEPALRRLERRIRQHGEALWGVGLVAGGTALFAAAGRTAYDTALALAADAAGLRAAAAGAGAVALVLVTGERLMRAGLAPLVGRQRSPELARAAAMAAPLTGALPVGMAAAWSAAPVAGLGVALALAASIAGAVHRLFHRWIRPSATPEAECLRPAGLAAPPSRPAARGVDPVCARFLRAAGVRVDIAARLAAAGYRTLPALAAAADEELLAIRGVGPATVRRIRARLGPALRPDAAARSGPDRPPAHG